MHAFNRLPYAEQSTLSKRSERSHTPNRAHFSASPLAPHLSAGFRMADRTNFFNKPPYAERNARLRQASICQAGRHRPPERAFDCPNAHFIQGQCHVRIAGCSSFLTFHADVESVGPLSRDRRPLKRNQLQKEADFLLLKTGARPKRNSRRDVGSQKEKADFLRSRLYRFRMVPEARVELARLSTTVFETAASAIPPLGREIELYPMFPKAQTEISEHAQKATIQAENR